MQLESEKHQASVRLTWDNEKKNWLLTAFEKKNSVSDNTTDTVGTTEGGKRNDTTTPQNTVSSGKGSDNSSLDQEKSEKSRRKKAKPTGEKIDDVGEKLAGARKDMRAEIAKALDDASVASLVELPFGKAYKKPNLAKTVESGALREEDARFFEAIFAAGINAKKPTLTKTEQSRKKYRVGYKTNVERWAEQTHTTLQMLKEFVEADEATRDEVMNKLLSMEYPKQEEEEQTLARLKELNPDYEGHTHEWGDKWTPNPVRVMMEVITRLGYKPGDKLDLPFTELKPITGFTGYRVTNTQGKTQYSTVSSVEDGIDRLVYLAKVKRGDSDVKHPMSEFSAVATKTEYAETGRYRVVYGSISSAKTKEFNSREEADKFVAELNSKGKQQSPYIAPIKDVSRRHGYVVRFCNPLTNEYSVVSEGLFDTKADAMAWLDENYEAANEKANASLKTEKKKREVTADDMLTVRMATKDGKTWNYSVYINEAYANNMGMPLELRGDFESRKEAKEYADSMKDRVFKAYKEAEAQRKAFVYFSTGEDSRLGEDYRGGKDVTAEDFMNTFGFRGVQLLSRLNDIKKLARGETIKSTDDNVEIRGDWAGYITIVFPKSTSAGGKYFKNKDLLKLVDNHVFYQENGKFKGDVAGENIDEAIRVLSNLGVRVKGEKSFQVGNIDADNSTPAQQAATDAVLEALNRIPGLEVVMETAKAGQAAAKNAEFMRVWHGSAAVFDHFDGAFMQSGEGFMVYGAGHYVTDVEGTGRMYAEE